MRSEHDINGAKLKRQIDFVAAGTAQVVDNDPAGRGGALDEDDTSPVIYRFGQRRVAVVFGIQKIHI